MNKKKIGIILIIFIFCTYFGEISAYAVNSIKSVYFYSSTCSDCLMIEKESEKEKSDTIPLNVSDTTNLKLFYEFCEAYNIADNKRSVPMLFIGDTAYTEVEDIIYSINNNVINENTKDLLVDINRNVNDSQQNNTRLTLVYLFLSGLLDGFNPCAVAMLLLLISLLGFVNDKKKIIRLSVSFIGGIFVTYYAIGTFLYSFVSRFDFSLLSILIKYFILVLCIVLAILNIKDAIYSSKMKHQKVVLQLPKRIKKFNKYLMNKVIAIQNKKFVYFIYFGLGVAISFTEFMCTGQIYLPVILLMSQTPNTSFWEIGFRFLIYNASFVLPLVVISIIAINKDKVVSISSIFSEKMYLIKILNAIFYCALGMLVLYLFI